MENRRAYKPSEVAEMIGVSRAGIYCMLHKKLIPSIRLGKRFIIPKDKFDEMMAGSQQQR